MALPGSGKIPAEVQYEYTFHYIIYYSAMISIFRFYCFQGGYHSEFANLELIRWSWWLQDKWRILITDMRRRHNDEGLEEPPRRRSFLAGACAVVSS